MDKLRQFLIDLLGQEAVDALTEEQNQQLESFADTIISKDEVVSAFQEGYKKEDGSIDLELVNDPEVKSVVEELLGQAKTAREEAETARNEAKTAQEALTGYKRSTALEKALSSANVVDISDFQKLFSDELKDLEVTDEGIEGLDAIIEEAKKSKPYLFKTESKSSQSSKKGFNPPGGEPTPNFDKMSPAELLRYRENNRN